MRRTASLTSHSTDYVFIAYAGAILLFGLLVLSSAGVAVGLDRFSDAYFFIKRQFFLGFLPGIVLFLIMSKINYSVWRKYALPIFILACIGLMLVFIPGIGSDNNTFAKSWIVLGNFSFQPIEATKLALVIYLAAVLSSAGSRIREAHGFFSILIVALIPAILVALQPDTGGMFILGALIVTMLFFAKARLNHLLIVFLVGIVAVGIMIFAAPYRADRFMTFLHPELDPEGQGYQINQAFLAIGTGGWFGLGLGHSRQKFQYLPEVHADSIFAVAAEELGFIVAVACIALYVLLVFRGFKIADNTTDEFGKYLVLGVMTWLGLQMIMNIGAMVGMLPLTGVPLPFVSHGGTALMIGMASLGMVVNVSKHG